jgi:hypothetical protein
MKTVFLDNEKIRLAAGERKIDSDQLQGLLVAGLIEIREAIEEQTRSLHWDGSALGELGRAVNATQDTSSALAQVINGLVPRVASIEAAVRSIVYHDQEMAELLAKIATKVGD